MKDKKSKLDSFNLKLANFLSDFLLFQPKPFNHTIPVEVLVMKTMRHPELVEGCTQPDVALNSLRFHHVLSRDRAQTDHQNNTISSDFGLNIFRNF